jgi:mono/diheme cytochrome c family protein
MKHYRLAVLLLAVLPLSAVAAPRAIPGVNAKDLYPAGCVDCHTRKAGGADMRLSALLAKWNGSVDPKMLAAMQAFVPKGMTLKGKHPPVTAALKDIPASCAKCHVANSKTMPPLAPLMHGVHLAKGDQSEFVKQFQGECTHCHKLNKASGTWSIPNGAEK